MRVPVVVVAVCLAPALAAPQSLGDAARRQARKRSTEAPAARVYTAEDLRPETDAPGAVSSVSGETGTVRSVGGETETATPPPPALATEETVRAQLDREEAERKQREGYWRQVAAAAHARLASAQREHETVCGPGVLALTGG